jgi:hypothetical protein
VFFELINAPVEKHLVRAEFVEVFEHQVKLAVEFSDLRLHALPHRARLL